ncbi:MFS transporter, MHS family, proline/betaine transporter [Granulicella rosea]|uniref:MFS transporter, MHS family, proline/betaine transporter n=1 Tax=Granulicella rosea TaxID=474952 RepID=A0A239L193_9BACT|nr:MFS transporter, MHS family, proline/betaine transporter [Granulicella rosea]
MLVYAYFAPVIAKLFFPTHDEAVSYLLTFMTFGLAYVARPLGSVVLGAYTDKHGRKASLMLSLSLMMLGTAMMTLMPTYAAIGILGPVGIALSRLLQGFAVGGEVGSSTTFMVEHAPPEKRTFYAAFQYVSQNTAVVTAALAGLILTTRLTPHQLDTWGWRTPFAFGLLVGPLGLYLRRNLVETPDFLAIEPLRSPLLALVTQHWRQLLVLVGIVAMNTAGAYFLNYLPTYAMKALRLPEWVGYTSTLLAGTLSIVVVLAASRIADRFGLIRVMTVTAALHTAIIWPVFRYITTTPSATRLLIGESIITLVRCIYSAPMMVLFARIFPPHTRGIGISFGYSLGILAFGGFAPAIFGWLIAITGSNLAPALYIVGSGVISLVSLYALSRMPSAASQ